MGILLLFGGSAQPLLLHDQFSGSGALVDHNPDTVWMWDNWQHTGQVGEVWTLNGSGGVSQTGNPASGTRAHYAYILAASNEPLARVAVRTPSSGNFRCGVLARGVWVAFLNKSNNRLELVESGVVRAFVAAGTLLNNTEYTIELECFGTTLIARGADVEVSYTSSVNQTKFHVGLVEDVGVTDGHPDFLSLRVRSSAQASPLASRIFYAPADALPAAEWDEVAISGTGGSGRSTANGGGAHYGTITANNTQDSGVRFQYQADESGQTPSKQAANAPKNLPDEAYYTCYYYIPSVIERLGTWWLLMQMKQRAADGGTYPVYFLGGGYTAPNMHAELDTNMDIDGSHSSILPDLSDVHFTFPAGQWVRVDMLYKWGVADGRLAFWMDNELMWDFPNIQTIFTEPPADWVFTQHPRQWSPAHYSRYLNPATSTIYLSNAAVSVGGRLPDDYPAEVPV